MFLTLQVYPFEGITVLSERTYSYKSSLCAGVTVLPSLVTYPLAVFDILGEASSVDGIFSSGLATVCACPIGEERLVIV